MVNELGEFVRDAPVIGDDLAIHPRDRRSRQDVVELVETDGPPDLGQPLTGVVHQAAYGCGGAPQLGVAQQVLIATVALLDLVLAGECAAVQLEIELPNPGARILVFGLGAAEERGRRLDGQLGGSVKIGDTTGLGEHLASGTTAAISIAEGHQGGIGAALVLEVGPGVFEVTSREVRTVGVSRREMGEDAGAVDSLPPEGVVGKLVDLVPRDLLGQEPLGASQFGQLR